MGIVTISAFLFLLLFFQSSTGKTMAPNNVTDFGDRAVTSPIQSATDFEVRRNVTSDITEIPNNFSINHGEEHQNTSTRTNSTDKANNTFAYSEPTVSEDKGTFAFRFYTGETVKDFVELPLENAFLGLKKSGFDPKKKTVIYFHGLHQNAESESVRILIGALLKRGNMNVLLVDWSTMSSNHYPRALVGSVWMAKSVADQVSKFVAEGVSPKLIHLVGHGLGANSAGYVGKRFTGEKLYRITGLDPAGPLFSFNNIGFTHLTPDDAEMVDVIHTDRGLYGIYQTCGTSDFFLNHNGLRFQAGCPFRLGIFTFDTADVCSHMFAWRVFAESIQNETAFQAVPCKTFLSYIRGECDKAVPVVMGYGASKSARGRHYLTTNSRAPYGRGMAGLKSDHVWWRIQGEAISLFQRLIKLLLGYVKKVYFG